MLLTRQRTTAGHRVLRLDNHRQPLDSAVPRVHPPVYYAHTNATAPDTQREENPQ